MKMLLDAIRPIGCSALFLWGASLLVSPASAAVESDIVGYATIDLTQGYTLVALPFLALGNEAANGMPIADVTGTLTADDRIPARSDALMVMDPTSKTYTTYRNTSDGWVNAEDGIPATDILPVGGAIFYSKSMVTGQIVASGKVVEEESVEVPLSLGYSLVSNPLPVEIKIAELVGEGLSADSRIPARADQIMVLDPATHTYTTYYLNADCGWTKLGGDGSETTDVIPACQGFVYVKSQSAGKLIFTSPL